MDLSWEKWLVMAALAIISILLGMAPYIIFHNKRKILPVVSSESAGTFVYELILSVLSCFGGGVLLATAVVHMLSEARQNLAEIPSIASSLESDFPLAEILTLIGFALIYLVEEIAHFIIADNGHHHHPVVRHNSSIHSISGRSLKTSKPSCTSVDVKDLKVAAESTFQDESHGIGTAVRSLLALIALSFHAIMEGIAIGIQESASLWFMFGAVASHKFVISFCMGMELFATRAKTSTYVGSIVFFGIISPVGIFIGTVLSSDSNNLLPIAVIKGLSTGTLLYVVFFEILNRERAKKETGKFTRLNSLMGFIQFASILIGMSAMTIMITLTTHQHGHEHEDSTTEDPDHDHDHFRFNNVKISSSFQDNLIIE